MTHWMAAVRLALSLVKHRRLIRKPNTENG